MARKRTPWSGKKWEPRIRFNWGYHDAAHEVRMGSPRNISYSGPHSPRVVSRDFDVAYYEGYKRGLRDQRGGGYADNSDAAWTECVADGECSERD